MSNQIRFYNPTGRNTKCHVVEVGGCDLLFSYSTLIGYAIPGIGRRRLPNFWGPTTGRHFSESGWGSAEVVDTSPAEFAAEAYHNLRRYILAETCESSPQAREALAHVGIVPS